MGLGRKKLSAHLGEEPATDPYTRHTGHVFQVLQVVREFQVQTHAPSGCLLDLFSRLTANHGMPDLAERGRPQSYPADLRRTSHRRSEGKRLAMPDALLQGHHNDRSLVGDRAR